MSRSSCTETSYEFNYNNKATEVLYSFDTTNGGARSFNCTNQSPIKSITAIGNNVNDNVTINFNTTTSAVDGTLWDLCKGGSIISNFQTLNTDVSSNNIITYTVQTPATEETPGTYNIEIYITPSGQTEQYKLGTFNYTPTGTNTSITGAYIIWNDPNSTNQTLGTCTIAISVDNRFTMTLTPPSNQSACTNDASYTIIIGEGIDYDESYPYSYIKITYDSSNDIPDTPNYYPQTALLYLGLMATLAGVIDGVPSANSSQQTFNMGLMSLMPSVFNTPTTGGC